MKLLFVSFSPIAMDVRLPEREPLGGSESCVAYLSRQMAERGHDVSLAVRLPPATPERLLGVRHVPLEALEAVLRSGDFEAVIALSAPPAAEQLRRMAPRALQVCWLHLLPGEKAMMPLPAAARHIDQAVFVSRTQQRMFKYAGPSLVIGNGIAPCFENMFATAEVLYAAKENRAAYTSMPYRGLHHLVEVIKRIGGDTAFDIYSGMQTYRENEDRFAPLYAEINGLPNARYHGALAQPLLAERLRPAAFLAYPCAFVETYCIAALEAIAAGLKVVSLALGALPETTLGFADLVPVSAQMSDPEVLAAFTALLKKNVADFERDPQVWAAERFAQSRTVNRLCSWSARAGEWEAFLGPAIAAKRGF